MEYLFITGAYRSGSTLLEKLLHNHRYIGVGSQPFPYLYFEAKSRFLDAKGLQRRYPIGHLFLEKDYTLEELYLFLEDCWFTANDIVAMLHGMTTYSGQYMPELLGFCQQRSTTPGTFYQVYQRFLQALADYLGKENLSYVGTKESFCEEFVPFFLSKKHKAIVIIRDPRDVVASLYFGQGPKYAGKARPVLYTARQWRKSVSFCLRYRADPGFTFVRYEDLVRDPWAVLDQLTEFLALPPFPRHAFSRGILDQQGREWQGNSSFGRHAFISTQSVGRFRETLPENCVRYIETVCYPEICTLGYEFLYQTDGPDEGAIRDFMEPIQVTHDKFSPDYSTNSRRFDQEIRRLEYLQSDMGQAKQRLWYIFPSVYQTLRTAVEEARNVVE